MNRLAFFTIMFTAALALSDAQAASIQGDVCSLSSGQIGLKVAGNSSCLPVVFMNSISDSDFHELIPGDGVILTGRRMTGPALVEIDSVDVVYLERIQGSWQDDKGVYYKIVNYDTILKYNPSLPTGTNTWSFSFEMYPNTKDRWNIILDDGTKPQVGILREYFDKKNAYHIELCLFRETPLRKRECSVLSRLVD